MSLRSSGLLFQGENVLDARKWERWTLDYIILAAAALAGIALFLFGETLLALLPRRVVYALLALILIGLAIYLSSRA